MLAARPSGAEVLAEQRVRCGEDEHENGSERAVRSRTAEPVVVPLAESADASLSHDGLSPSVAARQALRA
jgi:hypothetical protein